MLLLLALLAAGQAGTAPVDSDLLAHGRTLVLIDGKTLPVANLDDVLIESSLPRDTHDCVTQVYTADHRKVIVEYDWRAGAAVVMTMHFPDSDPPMPALLIKGAKSKANVLAPGLLFTADDKEAEALTAEFNALHTACAPH